MSIILFTNNARALLASSLSSNGTSVSVDDGSVFTALGSGQVKYLTIHSTPYITSLADVEIVKLTSRTSNTLTVVRAQEGSTGQAWDAGAFVDEMITAGELNSFAQGFDNGGNARGTNAVNLQSGRSNVANVASGANAVALGYNTKASSDYGIAVGSGVVAGTGAVAIGTNITATDDAIGILGQTNSGTQSIAIGDGADTRGNQSVGIGAESLVGLAGSARWQAEEDYVVGDLVTNANATLAMYCMKAGTSDSSEPSWPSASGPNTDTIITDGTVLWRVGFVYSSASSYCVGVGGGAGVIGQGVAVGFGSKAAGGNCVAIGRSVEAYGSGSIAIGNTTKAFGYNSIVIGAGWQTIPPNLQLNYYTLIGEGNLPVTGGKKIKGFNMVDWPERGRKGDFSEPYYNAADIATFFSEPVNLGDAPTRANSTTYYFGDVVFPASPNGYTYWVSAIDEFYANSFGDSGGSPPTYPTTDGVGVTDGGISLVCCAAVQSLTLPDYTRFIPIECGFIAGRDCDSAPAADAQVSFGTSATATEWIGATTLTKINGPYSCHPLDVSGGLGAKTLYAKIQAAGTGKIPGRFYWKGYVVHSVVA